MKFLSSRTILSKIKLNLDMRLIREKFSPWISSMEKNQDSTPNSVYSGKADLSIYYTDTKSKDYKKNIGRSPQLNFLIWITPWF